MNFSAHEGFQKLVISKLGNPQIMPVVPALGELRREDSSKFKASLSRHLLCMLTQQGEVCLAL